MEPSQKIVWKYGLRDGFMALGATQKELYSWVASTGESYVFTAEIDHIEPERNVYHHRAGTFEKTVPALTKEDGISVHSIRHAQELFDAVSHAYEAELKCRVMLVKGTKFGTTNGNVKTAADPDIWQVTELDGAVNQGFHLRLERTGAGDITND